MIPPQEIIPWPPFRKQVVANRGSHVVHTGGSPESWLLVPVIPSGAELASPAVPDPVADGGAGDDSRSSADRSL